MIRQQGSLRLTKVVHWKRDFALSTLNMIFPAPSAQALFMGTSWDVFPNAEADYKALSVWGLGLVFQRGVDCWMLQDDIYKAPFFFQIHNTTTHPQWGWSKMKLIEIDMKLIDSLRRKGRRGTQSWQQNRWYNENRLWLQKKWGKSPQLMLKEVLKVLSQTCLSPTAFNSLPQQRLKGPVLGVTIKVKGGCATSCHY